MSHATCVEAVKINNFVLSFKFHQLYSLIIYATNSFLFTIICPGTIWRTKMNDFIVVCTIVIWYCCPNEFSIFCLIECFLFLLEQTTTYNPVLVLLFSYFVETFNLKGNILKESYKEFFFLTSLTWTFLNTNFLNNYFWFSTLKVFFFISILLINFWSILSE